MIALFLAGGSGTRLWPLSRDNNPKQLHALVGDQSLMAQTVERVAPVIPAENVWIVTNTKYVDQVSEQSQGVPREQIVPEPFALVTNLAVGLGAIHVARHNPDEVMVVGWADSYISQNDEFREALKKAAVAAEVSDGVILGVRPTFPATGYGYIHAGDALDNAPGAFRIAGFEEKPDVAKAEQFLRDGSYLWNPGISVWKVSKLLALMEQFKPDHYRALMQVQPHLGTAREAEAMTAAFQSLDREPIDTAIFEKATRLATVPADLGWSDIGSWSTLYDVQDKQGTNVVKGNVVVVDTEGCVIYGQDRLIGTLGVSDLVIVDAGDALLVTTRDNANRLKELHSAIKAQQGNQYV